MWIFTNKDVDNNSFEKKKNHHRIPNKFYVIIKIVIVKNLFENQTSTNGDVLVVVEVVASFAFASSSSDC